MHKYETPYPPSMWVRSRDVQGTSLRNLYMSTDGLRTGRRSRRVQTLNHVRECVAVIRVGIPVDRMCPQRRQQQEIERQLDGHIAAILNVLRLDPGFAQLPRLEDIGFVRVFRAIVVAEIRSQQVEP